MTLLKTSIRVFAFFMLVTGIAYPLLITILAHWIAPHKASGSFIASKENMIGSLLIAQKFDSNKFFWPRPSAIDYIPLPSGGSNLGPTSLILKEIVASRRQHIAQSHELLENDVIPSELLFASGSGLDPHISVTTARFQIPRIIKARNWNKAIATSLMITLIDEISEKRPFFGTPYINVLKLNIALENLTVHPDAIAIQSQ